MRRFTSVIAAILVYLATGSAGLAIESCTITEVTPLTFGTLQKPASGSQTFTIRANGLGPTGTGTLLYGTTSRGEYTLRRTGVGGGFTSVTIDIQNISSGDPNLTLSTFTGRYGLNPIASFPEAGLNPPTIIGTTLYLGATATYNSSVAVGTPTPSFDIVVTYQ